MMEASFMAALLPTFSGRKVLKGMEKGCPDARSNVVAISHPFQVLFLFMLFFVDYLRRSVKAEPERSREHMPRCSALLWHPLLHLSDCPFMDVLHGAHKKRTLKGVGNGLS